MNSTSNQTILGLQNIEAVLADIRMEGFKFTHKEEALFQEIGRGKITPIEARQSLLNRNQNLHNAEPNKYINIPPELDVVFMNDVYPGTNVLVNKLGINDWDLLQEAERNLTGFRMIELRKEPVPGKFDFEHLKAIHYAIFQDIFPWAGQVRTLNIGKGEQLFCLVEHIESYQQEIFNRLKKENYYLGLESAKFAKEVAQFIGDLNALHPFREGNGRTQRELLRILAQNAGYQLDLSDITQEYMIFASRESFNGSYREFERIIKNRLKFIDSIDVS